MQMNAFSCSDNAAHYNTAAIVPKQTNKSNPVLRTETHTIKIWAKQASTQEWKCHLPSWNASKSVITIGERETESWIFGKGTCSFLHLQLCFTILTWCGDYFLLLFVHQEDLYFNWPVASLPLALSLALIKAVIVQTALFSLNLILSFNLLAVHCSINWTHCCRDSADGKATRFKGEIKSELWTCIIFWYQMCWTLNLNFLQLGLEL